MADSGRGDEPDDAPRTIQMRSDAVLEHAPPVMPTLTGAPVPHGEPPSMPPPRYELGSEIARGGMGRVVEATDTVLGRVVALKEALALDAEALRRFARETKITARLEHPSIVPVYDVGSMAGGVPFYVMRKVGGRPLERLVATAETLNQRLALIGHIIAAAHAVAHAHERGIVHRDIKPSNILCGELGETIVIDWGLAKVLGEPDDATPDPGGLPSVGEAIDRTDPIETRAGIVFGTPGFMAPEQLRGNVISERCDVYALGATLYHLLSRRPPHHAKTADEMMRAAAQTPATPIDQLVPGVPSELATIVDKALAHDPALRYQNARALAEELDRFLKGQLVASHRYSAGERLARFVRKNRVAVAAVTIALAALIVIGTIAVTRVVGERDRADDAAQRARQAQLAAEDRAEKLQLQQARIKVTSNPTEAIAMIKPLARAQWREVRSIATAARANGVAWSLPGPLHTRSLEMSRDGLRVLVAGQDGSVRTYDLARRTTRTLVERGAVTSARYADGERRVVVWSGARLAVLDAATGARIREVTAPSAITDLEVAGTDAYWVDEHGALWSLALSGTSPPAQPRLGEVTEKLEQIAPSPDGKWLALRGSEHLLFWDRSRPDAPALEAYAGITRDLDWSEDGSHVVALFDSGDRSQKIAVDIVTDPEPHIVHRVRVGGNEFTAFTGGRVYVLGPSGIGLSARSELGTTGRKQVPGVPLGVRESIDELVVGAGTGGVAVLTTVGDFTLVVPAGHLETFATSARSPYVVGMTEDRMIVWNLADIVPRRLASTAPVIERFAGNDRVLVTYADRAELIDLATSTASPLPAWSAGVLDVTTSADGNAICLLDAAHHARLFGKDGKAADELGAVDIALFAGNTLVLGTSSGAVELYDPATRTRRPVVTRGSRLVHLAASTGWIAAAFADSTLWRMQVATGAQATTPIASVPGQIAVADDGTLLFPDVRTLRAWRTTGTIEVFAELPKPVATVGIIKTTAIAVADDGLGFAVALDAPGILSAPFDLYAAQTASASRQTGLLAIANRGTIEVVDPLLEVAHRWTLAGSLGVTYTQAQISNDGRHVIARAFITDREKRELESRMINSLLVWDIVAPATADDTAQWLDRLTNAVFDQSSHLGWQ